MDLRHDDVARLRRKHGTQHAEMLLNGVGIRGQAVDGDERRKHGENRQEGEEGAARRHDGEIVVTAFAPNAFGNLTPAFERDLVGTPRVAAVRIRLAVHRRTDLSPGQKWPRQSSSKIVPGSEFAGGSAAV